MSHDNIHNEKHFFLFNSSVYSNLKILYEKNNIPTVTDIRNKLTSRFFDGITNNHTDTLLMSLGDYNKMSK